MADSWKSGYVADIPYTLGFYRELAPTFLNYACLLIGVDGLPLDRPLRYCELGCGRGFGTTLLAAANPGMQFVGIDFNPSHIAEARQLASAAGLTNITFHELSFAEAAESRLGDLADLDVIVAHGVYTWVESKVRRDIVEFVRTKLRAGGLLFASYNCMPGWASVAPLQQLLMQTAKRSTRHSAESINEGLALLKVLTEQPNAFIAQNPGLKARIERMGNQDRRYLAHEYLNSGWQPQYINDTIDDFAVAKMVYVGSASLAENQIELCVPKPLHALVRGAPDASMREMLKDYAVNKQFRRDIFVKGPQLLTPHEQRQRLDALTFCRTRLDNASEIKLTSPVGELKLDTAIIASLVGMISTIPIAGSTFLANALKAGLLEQDSRTLLMLLVNSNVVTPARSDHATVDRAPSERLNAAIMEMSIRADTHGFLASPILGSAVSATFADRIAAGLSAQLATTDTQTLANAAFRKLAAHGQHFLRDGKVIEPTPENVSFIADIFGDFIKQRRSVWKDWGLQQMRAEDNPAALGIAKRSQTQTT